MKQAGDRPDEKGGQKRGQPGSEDQFARGAAAPPDVGADIADEDGVPVDAEEGVERDAIGTEPALGDIERELAEQHEKYLRLAAEFDNFRKRSQRERLDAGARAQAELVRQMLEAMDDLGRFADLDPTVTDASTVVEGVQMVEKKLEKTLGAAGLEILDPVDQAFDPSVHEAVATEPALSPEDDNLIARVYQRGYVFKGLLIRPARVVVKQWND
jgi:molecular chaperone GrpE